MLANLRKYLVSGLLVWIPIGITIWIINFIITSMDNFVPFKRILYKTLGFHLPGIGLIFAIIIIILTGIIATNVIGQRLVNVSNKMLLKVPVFKSIYKGVKQVSDTLLSNQSKAFSKAVLIQFGSTNSWTIALLTSNGNHFMDENSPEEYINVYVPTTPNPTSGYFLIIKKSDTREINMSVDEALGYIIAMGSTENLTNYQKKEV